MSEGLGARLRREREDRGIPLATIAATTKVSAALFEALERDDVSRWPPGIFRRAFVRAYAQAIGLDPDVILREFLEQFPEPTDPPAAGPAEAVRVSRRPYTGLRLTLADAPAQGRFSLAAELAKRCAAAVVDGAFVFAAATGALFLRADFWMALGTFALCYYVIGTLFLGTTPGVWLLTDAGRGRPQRPRPIVEPVEWPDPAYDRGIGAIASVSDPLSSS
jgi:transcriptional regulator with XRE-family HTH domain